MSCMSQCADNAGGASCINSRPGAARSRDLPSQCKFHSESSSLSVSLPLIFQLQQQSHQQVLRSIAQCAGAAGMALLYGLLTGCGAAAESHRASNIHDAIAAPRVYEGSCAAASSPMDVTPAAYPGFHRHMSTTFQDLCQVRFDVIGM